MKKLFFDFPYHSFLFNIDKDIITRFNSASFCSYKCHIGYTNQYLSFQSLDDYNTKCSIDYDFNKL